MNSDNCPMTPLRHRFPDRASASRSARSQSNNHRDTFRVYQCPCGAWHWHRIVSLAGIKREGIESR